MGADHVANGLYDIYTYTVWPDSQIGYTSAVRVSNSITQNPQFVTGPMPGNGFVLGVTHSIHEIQVTAGTFSVEVDFDGSHAAMVNGFQIVPVPEPGVNIVLSSGLILVTLRRRNPSPDHRSK